MSALTPTAPSPANRRYPTHEPWTKPHRRVLVVADEACTAPNLCAGIRTHADGRTIDVLILAPTHDSPRAHWVVDEEDAISDAKRRLRASVACLGTAGIDAEARVGDPDPVQAIADALRDFPADEIVILTGPLHRSSWMHHNVIDRARREFEQLIEHVVVDPQGQAVYPHKGPLPHLRPTTLES